MQPDRRRVQTAVTGDPHSAEPAYMPTDPEEATRFRDHAHQQGQTHWCGTLLGGCGGRLTLKIVRERDTVPHFAHRADSNLCARFARGAEHTLGGQSADHLYAHRHLRTWLSEHQHAVSDRAEYVGLAPGKACTELVVPTLGKPLRLVFTADLDHDLLEVAKSPIAQDYVWLVRANQALTRALVANAVPYRLFRLTQNTLHDRGVQVGIRDSSGSLAWVPLSACVLREGALHKVAPSINTTPSSPGRETSQDSPSAPEDPLEQALRGLRHTLAQADSRANIAFMSDLVRRQQRAARARGLAPDLAAEARELLDQAAAALRPHPATEAPQPPPPVVNTHEREQERTRQEQRTRQIARRVDQLLGKLTWAKTHNRSNAYDDNRAELVKVLNRPETPKTITDRIKQQLLAEFPKDLFAAPEPPRQRPPRRRARPQGRDRRRDTQTPPAAAPQPSSEPAEGLQVQARIEERSRQILNELRASGQRPVPKKPPSERW